MASKKKTTPAEKVDGYQVITDRIIAELENGTVPWRKPWRSVGGFRPTSLSSGKPYQGINELLLSIGAMASGYGSIYWGTYRQIAALGGQVRKGQKSTQVVLWKPLVKNEGTPQEQRFWMMRLYYVFNAEQADWEEGKMPQEPTVEDGLDFTPVEAAERIAEGMPKRPLVKHGGDRAYYSPNLDYVQMPNHNQFTGEEAYYSTLFHELVHSTGHKSRIGREGIEAFAGFGSESYSREELIAEMGAAYLCAEAGIEPRVEQNAAYIASWLKVLRNDKKIVVAAASGAGKAADFILGRSTKEDTKEGEA